MMSNSKSVHHLGCRYTRKPSWHFNIDTQDNDTVEYILIAEPVTEDCLPRTEWKQCSTARSIEIHLTAHCQKGHSLFLFISTTLVIKVRK